MLPAAFGWRHAVRNEAICKLVGRRLRWRRRSLDLTQLQVAKRCGITFQQIQKYESGQVDVSIGRLVVLADVLDMPLAEILDGLAACVGANDRARPAQLAPAERVLLA